MRRLALLVLLAGCASYATAVDPPEGGGEGPRARAVADSAVRNAFGGWDVRLSDGRSCSLLASDAATASAAIDRCRLWLGMVPS